jgi:hypothetical protein
MKHYWFSARRFDHWTLVIPWSLRFVFCNFAALAAAILLTGTPSPAHPALAETPDYPIVAGFDRFYAPEDDEAKIA